MVNYIFVSATDRFIMVSAGLPTGVFRLSSGTQQSPIDLLSLLIYKFMGNTVPAHLIALRGIKDTP